MSDEDIKDLYWHRGWITPEQYEQVGGDLNG